MLRQYLQDNKGTYRLISEEEVHNGIWAIKLQMGKITMSNIPLVEVEYFTVSLLQSDDNFHDPLFYSMPKVDKETIHFLFDQRLASVEVYYQLHPHL